MNKCAIMRINRARPGVLRTLPTSRLEPVRRLIAMSESYHAFQLSFSPSTSELEAYLAGVIKGDGSCTDYIRLGVADLDFAQAFADAIKQVFHVSVTPRKDKRGYWHAKTCNYTGKFSYLLTFEPTTLTENAQWLRGMFDSEGNAQIHKLSRGENCYGRRVAMYSTMLQTLERACEYLSSLGIKSCIRTTKNSPGHKGTKTVYELSLLSGKVNFDRFRVLVGTSLARKQERLDAIVASYV